MLTIYGRKSAFNVQKVMWLIGELGIAHKNVELGGSFGDLDTPGFLELNPHGKVPVINDDGTVVWESHAILRYLAACYGDKNMWSNDPEIRSHVDRWMDWSQTTLQPDFLTGVFWGFYRTPEAQRNKAAVDDKIARCARHMQLLNSHLADKKFMTGNHFTMADVTVGTHLYRYFNIDIPRPKVPSVERWYKLLQDRPAYKAHVMVPFQDMFGRLNL